VVSRTDDVALMMFTVRQREVAAAYCTLVIMRTLMGRWLDGCGLVVGGESVFVALTVKSRKSGMCEWLSTSG